MSSVVLDAGATPSQVPAVYAESLVCGAGGLIAGTDPTVGVKFSRQYGPLAATTELLAAVRKDVGLPPSANAGGTLDCAGITFQGSTIVNTTGPNPQDAGNSVMGYADLVGGVATIQSGAVNAGSPTNRSVIYLTRLGAGVANIGPLSIQTFGANSFTVHSLLSTTGALNAADNGSFNWMIINPSWSA